LPFLSKADIRKAVIATGAALKHASQDGLGCHRDSLCPSYGVPPAKVFNLALVPI
jgi:hypothetical protein